MCTNSTLSKLLTISVPSLLSPLITANMLRVFLSLYLCDLKEYKWRFLSRVWVDTSNHTTKSCPHSSPNALVSSSPLDTPGQVCVPWWCGPPSGEWTQKEALTSFEWHSSLPYNFLTLQGGGFNEEGKVGPSKLLTGLNLLGPHLWVALLDYSISPLTSKVLDILQDLQVCSVICL